VDIDPNEIDKFKTSHAAIVGDIGQVLEGLLPLVERKPCLECLLAVRELKRRCPLRMAGSCDPNVVESDTSGKAGGL
jgi:acetolactate synthase-1/2/3 large subunit